MLFGPDTPSNCNDPKPAAVEVLNVGSGPNLPAGVLGVEGGTEPYEFILADIDPFWPPQPPPRDSVMDAVKKAAYEDPKAALEHYFSNKQDSTAFTLFKDFIWTAIAQDPIYVLSKHSFYSELLSANVIVESCARQCVRNRDQGVLDYYDLFKSKSYSGLIVLSLAADDAALVNHLSATNSARPPEKRLIKKAAGNLVFNLLDYFESFENKPYLKDLLLERTKTWPAEVLSYYPSYANFPWAEDVCRKAITKLGGSAFSFLVYDELTVSDKNLEVAVMAACEESPHTVIVSHEFFKSRSFYASAIDKAVTKIARSKGSPDFLLEYSGLYADAPYAQTIIRDAAEASPRQAFHFAEGFKAQPYAESVLVKAAAAEPRFALERLDKLIDLPYAAELFALAADLEPHYALRWASHQRQHFPWSAPPIRQICYKHPDLAVLFQDDIYFVFDVSEDEQDYITASKFKKFLDYPDANSEEKRRMCILTDRIFDGEITLERALEICRNPSELLRIGVRIKDEQTTSNPELVEATIQWSVAKLVNQINRLFHASQSVRFSEVSDFGSLELVSLLTHGRGGMYTSTFNGLFDRLILQLDKKEGTASGVLSVLSDSQVRIFFEELCTFNRLEDFFSRLPEKDGAELLQNCVSGLDQMGLPDGAIPFADAIALVKNKELLKQMRETIRDEYERVKGLKDESSIVAYGMLAGMLAEHPIFLEDRWLQQMAGSYRLPMLKEIPSDSLFDPSGVCRQQYYFYDDPDGEVTFDRFLKQYEALGWSIEGYQSFVVSKSPTVRGKRIEIYANRPNQYFGADDIRNLLYEKELAPRVIVHRGHGFHVGETIYELNPNAKFVCLGSCGSYQEVLSVLAECPDAHILVTKGLGTISVNEPLLGLINQEILSGSDLNWKRIWEKAKALFRSNPDFDDYICPANNACARFAAGFNRYLE